MLGDGKLWCRGDDWRQMMPFFTPEQPVVDITGFNGATCVLQRDGKVFCLGETGFGALGRGYEPSRHNALAIEGVPPAVSVASDSGGGCLVGRDGTVWCWGDNSCGELGNGLVNENFLPSEDLPSEVVGLSDMVQVAVGDIHSCALGRDGDVWCWGFDNDGELGDGTFDQAYRAFVCKPTPTKVLGLSHVTEIAATGYVSCAKKRDGSVWCWGSGYSGGLPGGLAFSSVPVKVPLP